MGQPVYLSPDVRYRLGVHEAHEGQIGPDAPAWSDGRRGVLPPAMHYCGLTVEHRTADPDYDGRPGHVSWQEAGWCPGAVMWCGDGEVWTLESFDPLTLSPSVLCSAHPDEFHVFIRDGKVA